MAPAPFATGPIRETQVLSLSFFRTGSQSLKEALTILGYKDVFHTSVIARDITKWPAIEVASDNNIACLPTYTGRTYSREDFDAIFGPCEALTDLTPLAEPLLKAYPNARVILVHRDFDAWADSFLNTLVLPATRGPLAWLSTTLFEPMLGIRISQVLCKIYMGLIGVSDVYKLRNRHILKAGYDRHYDNVRRMVPPERLLEIDLKDLNWKPLCEFLDKEEPNVPFPRLNESRVLQHEIHRLHWMALFGFTGKIVLPVATAGAAVGYWYTRLR